MNPYKKFLAAKQIKLAESGLPIKPNKLNPLLFDFQRDVVSWALRKGRAALFLDCGMGKTVMQLEFAQHVPGDVLILAPLAVAQQTVREAEKFGIKAEYSRDGKKGKITVANYEMLEHFSAADYEGIVLDECFPPDTPVDTPLGWRYIKDVRKGQPILNAAGIDEVADVHRREIQSAVRVFFGTKAIINSPNHPYFTERGWVCAQDLQPGDAVMETREAMWLVRENCKTSNVAGSQKAFLRQVLLSELEDEAASNSLKGSQSTGSSQERQEEICLVSVGIAEGTERIGTHQKSQSHERSECSAESLPHIESNEAQTFRTWRKWSRSNAPSADHAQNTWVKMEHGVSLITGQADSWLSNALQTRLSESRKENRHRSGWLLASLPQEDRPKERCETGFVRVEGIEILEPGHPDLERYRDAEGHIYFYDLGATRHPSFSVNGLLVHNSSILKSFDGAFRNQIIEAFAQTPFRLACTATPAPNDYMELGNHSEFLGALSRTEMLSTFFVHDGGSTKDWRVKRHAQNDFWKWVCSWAVMMRRPSDLGYPDRDFILPEMEVHDISIEQVTPTEGMLFAMPAATLQERRQARSGSIDTRGEEVARLVATKPMESWLIWCNLNSESDEAVKRIPEAVEIRGANSREEKEDRMLRFSTGEIRVLVTKPSIAGHGMNWQHCSNVIFYGLSDSYEDFYQAVRRAWRFGQKNKVNCYIVTSSNEGAVTENIKRKERDATQMAEEMVNNMHELNKREIHGGPRRGTVPYATRIEKGQGWEMQLGDAVELTRDLPTGSIHYSIFSPPFASLYTYSASERDMGNCRTHSEFYEHFRFLVNDLFRVMMAGRLVSFHCMNLPKSKERDGVIGITDFRGELIRMFEAVGFIYHSEVVIWKDPVTAMQRTKAIGLLHKQLKKDSTISRQGIPDYLVTMRKPGENPERVTHTNESFPVSLWQKYASPVWMDINPSNTLQRKSAREHEDERHICPLQLQVIQRAIALWTNPKDVVLSPFAGIGSEGYVALQEGRRFLGFELKESYFKQACLNLKAAKSKTVQMFEEELDNEESA